MRERRIDYFSHLSTEIIQLVRYFDVPPSQLCFLDFSMGFGHWCRVAQSFGCKVHGTEFSKIRAEHALGKGVAVIDYAEIPKFRYDFINAEQVFEHLPNPREVLFHLKESLKQHGILKISTPNGWDVKKRLQIQNWEASKVSPDSLNPVAPLEHVNCFDHEALITLASTVGLSIVDLDPTSWPKKIKSALRPYYHKLRRIKSPAAARRKGTCLAFSVS